MAKIVEPQSTEWLRKHPGEGRKNADGSVYAPEVLVVLDHEDENKPSRVFSFHPFKEMVLAGKYSALDDGDGLMSNVIEKQDITFAHEIDIGSKVYFAHNERWITGSIVSKDSTELRF